MGSGVATPSNRDGRTMGRRMGTTGRRKGDERARGEGRGALRGGQQEQRTGGVQGLCRRYDKYVQEGESRKRLRRTGRD